MKGEGNPFTYANRKCMKILKCFKILRKVEKED